jgi:hypothetical protein
LLLQHQPSGDAHPAQGADRGLPGCGIGGGTRTSAEQIGWWQQIPAATLPTAMAQWIAVGVPGYCFGKP